MSAETVRHALDSIEAVKRLAGHISKPLILKYPTQHGTPIGIFDYAAEGGYSNIASYLEVALALEEVAKEWDVLLCLLREARPHIGDEYMRSWPDDDDFDAMLARVDAALAAKENDDGK